MAYPNLGLNRTFASAPTLDTERRAPFSAALSWSPNNINIFGQTISIDIPTGNLIVSADDVSYPYYNFSLGINRKYDVQEQHMQLSFLRNYPNVNPKPHWFGNWQFGFEADVDEVWHNTHPELHVSSGAGANGLFEIYKSDFQRNLKSRTRVNRILRMYGIPGRTLASLDWEFKENDFVLRTRRGPFQILAGRSYEESLVDDIDAQIWLFNPISGGGFKITSNYFYNIPGSELRDVGFPLVVSKLIDALGHGIELTPVSGDPPYQAYLISDLSGREFRLEMGRELTFLDGLNPGGLVRKRLVSRVIDGTKGDKNEHNYSYNENNLLENVIFPSTIGDRHITYHYDESRYPGILKAIENSFGDQIKFEYVEDQTDNDERLNPRLKIKEITDPEGIVFKYDYDHQNSNVVVTISQDGKVDRQIKYTYIRDTFNTKHRYIAETEIEVARGYYVNAGGQVQPRDPDHTQIVRSRTTYTKDGRFNVESETDPLGRNTRYLYNEFNQVVQVWDPDGHWIKNTYDIAISPPTTTLRYDLIRFERQNIVRSIDELSPSRPFVETPIVISKRYTYNRYNANTSGDIFDHSLQSTHRIQTIEDARQNIWAFKYDDEGHNSPLSPTLLESPLKNKKINTYSNRGEVLTTTDPEHNVHTYTYTSQGFLDTYTNPNKQTIKLTYYAEAPWIRTLEDQGSKVTTFLREADGRLKKVIDAAADTVDYEYMNNGRGKRVIHHRPAVPATPRDSTSPSLITPFANLATEFAYSPLGGLRSPKEC